MTDKGKGKAKLEEPEESSDESFDPDAPSEPTSDSDSEISEAFSDPQEASKELQELWEEEKNFHDHPELYKLEDETLDEFEHNNVDLKEPIVDYKEGSSRGTKRAASDDIKPQKKSKIESPKRSKSK